jgi:hypothetical protein
MNDSDVLFEAETEIHVQRFKIYQNIPFGHYRVCRTPQKHEMTVLNHDGQPSSRNLKIILSQAGPCPDTISCPL